MKKMIYILITVFSNIVSFAMIRESFELSLKQSLLIYALFLLFVGFSIVIFEKIFKKIIGEKQ